jgi:prepilin-type N-terminal cleavage/methylation domain-containing protein
MRINQKGFTLIEIIAVLVILGILAAVAVPKYMDLTAEARNKAANAALAEGMARVNMSAAKLILQTGSVPSEASVLAAVASYTDAGDFSLAYAAGTGAINITASGTAGNVSGGSITGAAGLPTN